MQANSQLSRLEEAHGRLQKISTVDYDSEQDLYECVLTFADDERFMVLWTLEQIQAVQHGDRRLPQKQFTTAATKIPQLSSFAAKVDANRTAQRSLQADKMPQETLSQYAARNKQRTRLCNGRLYTRQVLDTIDQASLPAPFQ